MVKLFELIAFAVSIAAFAYGASRFFKKDIPKYFKLYVFAAGCYMLEELWVIVNSFLGNGIQDGLVTVRLFGSFGCLCFMLSANANEFDKVVDEGQSMKPRALALIAPAVLLIMYGMYALSSVNKEPAAAIAIGFLSISPALPASYFSLKHLLLPDDALGFLRSTKAIDILALVFYAAIFVYPLLYLFTSIAVMGIYDIVLAVMLLAMIVLCGKGAVKWNPLI